MDTYIYIYNMKKDCGTMVDNKFVYNFGCNTARHHLLVGLRNVVAGHECRDGNYIQLNNICEGKIFMDAYLL